MAPPPKPPTPPRALVQPVPEVPAPVGLGLGEGPLRDAVRALPDPAARSLAGALSAALAGLTGPAADKARRDVERVARAAEGTAPAYAAGAAASVWLALGGREDQAQVLRATLDRALRA